MKSSRRVLTFQIQPATHIIKAAEPSETVCILLTIHQLKPEVCRIRDLSRFAVRNKTTGRSLQRL